MTDWNALPDETFGQRVRAWVEANYPPDKRFVPRRVMYHEIEDWYQALSRQGWLCPAWPREYGGMGLSAAKYVIFVETLERHGCARVPDQGIQAVGPLLIRYGTPEQRDFFLPRILSGEHIWCQGYSEPNAGSDLASLKTEAVREGDVYVINGSKIWTSMAQTANWIYLLVRTDRTARKPQEGISFLLCSLESRGVTVRPIRNIKGDEEFCQVFFDDVRTPARYIVGRENDGWTMAKALLGFERIFICHPRQSEYALARLRLLADAMGAFTDPVFLDRYAAAELDVRHLRLAFERVVDALRRGGTLGNEVSWLKVWATETFQRVTELAVDLAGDLGAFREDLAFGDLYIDVMNQFLEARPATIYSGANEVQRDIVAKQVLHLPTR